MSSRIKGIEKIESAMGEWVPSNLAVIEGVELRSMQCGLTTNLLIEALFQSRRDSWPDFDKEMFRVEITFTNVRGLCLNGFGGGSVQVMGFDIRFIGDRGLEGINYEIEDYEDDRIRFKCSDVSIQSVTSKHT